MSRYSASWGSISGRFSNNLQFFVNLVRLLAEGKVHHSEVIFEFQGGVAHHRLATLLMESRSIHVNLNFVHHIDMCLTCKLTASD